MNKSFRTVYAARQGLPAYVWLSSTFGFIGEDHYSEYWHHDDGRRWEIIKRGDGDWRIEERSIGYALPDGRPVL